MPRHLRVLAVLLLVASGLRGQDSVPASTTVRTAAPEWLRNLPIDFIEDYFILEPGIGPAVGGFSIRGGQPYSFATYIDGTPVDAGYRGAGQGGGIRTFLGATGSRLQLPLVGATDAGVTIGVLRADMGGGQSGVFALGTARGKGHLTAGFDYATDELWGAGNSLGLNRLEASLAGGLGSRVGFALSGTLTGQYSAAYGPGQRDVPIYLSSGIATTVAVPTAIGDPLSDTTLVDVIGFEENAGLQVPSSTQSDYQLLGRVDFAIAERTGVSFTAAGSQDQGRRFDYVNLYNPQQLAAQRAASHAYTLSLNQDFGNADGRTRALEVALSLQGDQFESGPLSAQGELDSRDPAGGFLIAPLDFRFGLDDFAVNEELVNNVLFNTTGSRRSPYDLENSAQYSLTDEWRNNAYGLLGFTDGGGPTGRLALMDEDRMVGRATLDWALNASHDLRIGGEFVEYDLSNYSHALTSQAFSDVYIEHPTRQAAFVEDHISFGDAVLTAGLRYDRFKTGAQRVEGAPRISTNPAFDAANPDVDAFMTPDQAHAALSPRIQIGYRMNPSTDLRFGIGRQVQMPDFGTSLAGISTDLSVTNTSQVFGSDLDYASTLLTELGGTHRFSPSTIMDLSLYAKQLSGQAVVRLVNSYDPLTGRDIGIFRVLSDGEGDVLGVDIRLEQQIGPYLKAFVGYAFQDATMSDSVPANWSRPHTLAGAFGATLPEGWKDGSALGAILENSAAWGTFRFASGTPYTACGNIFENARLLSGQPCVDFFESAVNEERLPMTKQFDLKLARSFALGGARVTGYLDVRNLFNFDNTNAVFTVTGTRESPVLEAQTWTGDSAGYANEASQNGALLGDGSIDLQFAGPGGSGCGNWVEQSSSPASPNCVYLVGAEQRFGDGDGIYDVAEQRRASNALYHALNGGHLLTGPGRFIRLGIAVEL